MDSAQFPLDHKYIPKLPMKSQQIIYFETFSKSLIVIGWIYFLEYEHNESQCLESSI